MSHSFKNSSMLRDCSHEGDCLTVTFRNGKQYKYHGVPQEAYHEFIKAESAGKHFGEHIKGRYKHEKVDD